MAEGDERSLIEFGYYREGLQRFEYFIVGVSLALCAYVGQTLRPEKLIFLSPYTIEVASLLLLVLSVVSGFKRIESLVQCSMLNARGLDAREKRGALVAAQPDARGLVVNAISGEAFDRQTVTNSVRHLTATIKSVDERLEKESRRAGQWYKMRNALLFVGFCGLVLSKVLGPYLHTGKAGWSWGCVSAVDSNGRTIFVADAHRDDGKHLVVRADEKLTAFMELESAIRG